MTQKTTHIKMAIHGQFYQWASQFVDGKVVLDAGCGDGRGSKRIAPSAKRVIAVDRDSEQVKLARLQNAHPNIIYEEMDCQRLQIESKSIDVVVSNALLEYLTDVPAFLSEAQRVLKPDGTFICGTKNLEHSHRNDDGTPLYILHLQEYSEDTFRDLLAEYFADFRVFGQQMTPRAEKYVLHGSALGAEKALIKLGVKELIPKAVRRVLRRLVTGVSLHDIDEGDFFMSEDNVRRGFYLTAIAAVPRSPGEGEPARVGGTTPQ